ncbi:MAG: addiction module antidote protein, HigA family [Alphaproteobacteria bacterium]|nr:addiction module antidote protein, HigA family [Alphaproteobacteria bacterium]
MVPVHPGRALADELEARNMTANALAQALRVTPSRIGEIIAGKRAITAETAVRLGRYLGTGPGLWVRMQGNYDIAKVEQDLGARIAKEVEQAA